MRNSQIYWPHRRAGSTQLEGGRLLMRRNPPKAETFLQPATPLNTAPPACPPQNLWFAQSAGSLAGQGVARAVFQRCRCPSYGGSGCEHPLTSSTHR